MARKNKKRSQRLRDFEQDYLFLATRGGLTLAIALIIWIAATPVLRLFVAGALVIAVAVALVFRASARRSDPPQFSRRNGERSSVL
jgi:hypothetical protein